MHVYRCESHPRDAGRVPRGSSGSFVTQSQKAWDQVSKARLATHPGARFHDGSFASGVSHRGWDSVQSQSHLLSLQAPLSPRSVSPPGTFLGPQSLGFHTKACLPRKSWPLHTHHRCLSRSHVETASAGPRRPKASPMAPTQD